MSTNQIVNIGGKQHRLCVFRIESRDEQGRPESLTFIPDDREVELSTNPDANQFILGWVSLEGLQPGKPVPGQPT